MKKIINVFIFISVSFLLLPMALAKKTDHFVVLPDWYNKFDCNKKQERVLDKNTTMKALCNEYVKKSLLDFQNSMHYTKWELGTKKNKSTGDWFIEIKSKELIPGASCLIKMNASGDIYFKKCHFNK